MSPKEMELVLASASPRRRELLERIGIPFRVEPSDIDERPLESESAPIHVVRIAREKALAGSFAQPGLPVLAADTVVVVAGRILGKPRTRAEAAEMLAGLAGRSHLVLTAMSARWQDHEATRLSSAKVSFVPYDNVLYDWYVRTGEGDDKAGAYAVQGRGALLVSRVEGNVQAVVGLPLALLPGLFRDLGLALVRRRDRLALEPVGM